MAFPSNQQYQPLLLGSQPIFDVLGDESPSSTDIVGNSQFPAGYFAYDGQTIYFRIRLNTNPVNSQLTGFRNFAWGILVNTSGTPGVYDWLVNVNGLNNTINLVQNTVKQVNSWNDPAEGTNGQGAPNYSRPIVNFDVARSVLTNDGSNFGGNPDYFIEFQFSASDFFQTLGIAESTPLQFIIFSSANANNYNKDSLRTSEGFHFSDALTDPVTPDEVDVRAELTVSKSITSGPASILNGNEGSWTQQVTVTNMGRSLARQVFVNDLFQVDQLTSVNAIVTSAGTAAYNSSTRTISWNIGNLNPGQTVTLTYGVTGTFTSSGTRNLNTVTASGIDDFTGGQLPVQTVSNTVGVVSAASITGQVLSGVSGLPLTGVTVELRNAMNVLIATTTTNGNGQYNFTSLTPGSYSLSYLLNNYMTATRSVTVTAGQTEVVNVLLTPDPGSITGTVRTTGNVVIPGAEVHLVNNSNVVLSTAITDAQGEYTFNGVTPGSYVLTVSASTYQSETRGTTVQSNAATVEDFQLPGSPGTVAGTVRNEANVVIPNATVEVLDLANNVIATATTNPMGMYTIDQLAPGTYTLRTSAPLYQTSLLGFTVAQGQTVTQDVILLDQPGTLFGEVTDDETGNPLEGVAVQVIHQSGVTVATALTDAAGNYSITNLPPGSYTVTISQPGYADATIGTIITPNGMTMLNVELVRSAGTIEGVVEDENNQPISGAFVQLLVNGVAVASTVTNGSGQYSFQNVAPESYSVRASAGNFQTQVLGAQVIAFVTTVVNFTLPADPGILEGTVTDGMDSIPGTIITVRTSVGDVVVATGVTDENGFYTVSALAPGFYTVTATAVNFQSSAQGVFIQSNATTTEDFTLLPNPVSIIGTVINQQTGDPITGAQIEVRVLDVNGVLVQTTFTDTNGEFLVDQLSPGTYTVVASSPSFQTNFATVTVPPGGQESITLSLIPNPGTLTGTITSETSGSGIAGAIVQAVNQSNVQIGTVVTDQNGQYTFTGLPPGNYNVIASAEGFQTKIGGALVLADTTTVVDLALVSSPGVINGTVTPVQAGTIIQLFTANNVFIASVLADANGDYQFSGLAPGNYILTAGAPNFSTVTAGAVVVSNEVTTIDFVLTANPASFSGEVVAEGGLPIPNATIAVYDANEVLLSLAGTDADGFYSVSGLPAGSLTIVVTAPGYSQVIAGILLEAGDDLQNVDFTLIANPGSISGFVTDADNGNPLANTVIVIRKAGTVDQVVATVTTSPFGNYTVGGLAPGSYTVTASLEGYGTQLAGAVVVSDTTTNANVALSVLRGSIEGQLVDSIGNPITGGNLQVRLTSDLNVVIATILAQPDGSFLFENIFPGTYLVTATAPGYQTGVVGVLVEAGEVTQTIILLNASPAVLTGQVLSAQTSAGISGSTVTVTHPLTGGVVGTAFTDPDGNFNIDNLPAGTYNVSASAQDFGSASSAVFLEAGGTSSVTLALSPNPGDVSGTVIDRITGAVLSGAGVQIFDATGAFVFSTATDALGNYVALGLSPGTYTAVAGFTGYSNQLISFTVNSGETAVASFALDPNPSTLNGTITDEGGNPIIGAEIIVRQFTATGPVIATAVSHADGGYLITTLPQGSFTVIVTAPGFGTETASVLLTPGSTFTRDFVLEQIVSNVEGVVIDAGTGDPLPNVLIQLFNDNGVLIGTFQTGTDGFYKIEDFTPGSYTITFTNPNYQTLSIGFTTAAGETAAINPALTADPGVISGQVLDLEGNPLIGASVRVFPALGLLPIATLITDGTGSFLLEGVAPGPYVLVASFEGYANGETGVTVTSNQTSISTILLAPNPATITGNVSSSLGGGIPNASVQVLDQNETVLGTTVTDDFGNYALSNLPPGNHQVIVSAPGFATLIAGIILEPGQVLENNDFVLTPNPGRITGQVTDSTSGQPVVGAVNVVRTVAGVPVIVASAVTDVDGNYVIEGLARGSYSISSTAVGYGITTVGAIVESGQTTMVDISLSPEVGTLSGVVTDENGMPILNSQIEIKVFDQAGNLILTVFADSEGEFIIPELSPGSYLLSIAAPMFQTTTVGAIVEAGETTFLTVPLRPNPAIVIGQVIDADTLVPIAGAVVSVTDVNGLPITSTVTDVNGEFAISGLPATTVTVSATAPGYGTASTAVILTAGATVETTLSLVPNPGGVFGAVFAQSTADPIPGAVVQIFDETRALVVTLVTDPDGSYQFSSLAPGTYRVVVTAVGFGAAVQDIEVIANQQTQLDFALQLNPGNIRGMVFNAVTGDPLIGVSVVVRQFSPTGPIIQTTATDSNGEFLVIGLTPGSYSVTAFTPDFGSQTASVSVAPNATTVVSLGLFPDAGSIEGLVTSSVTGEILRDTRVSIFDNLGVLVVTTQSDISGRYRVDGLSPGDYTVVFFHPSFQLLTIGTMVLANQVSTVNAALLSNPGTVQGGVLNAADESPLSGAVVQLFPAQSLIPVANAVTDETGFYSFSSVAPGEYVVTATLTGYARGAVGATVIENEVTMADLFLISNPASISGTVRSSEGSPIQGATVRVIDDNEIVLGTGITGLDGTYFIGNLPPGSHEVIFSASGFGTVVSAVILSPGEEETGVDATLQANPGAISGRVFDSSTDEAIAGADLVVRRVIGDSSFIVASSTTDSSGRYTIAGLSPGLYTITASAVGYGPRTFAVVVAANQVSRVDIPLVQSTGLLAGEVVDSDGMPITIQGISVQIFDQQGRIVETLLADNFGEFSVLNLAPGSYRVVVSAPGYQAASVSVDIRAGETTRITVVLEDDPGTVAVNVRDGITGQPIPGASVTVTLPDGTVVASGVTDINGDVILPGLPTGELILVVAAENYQSETEMIGILPNQVLELNVTLQRIPLGRVIGQVVDEETTFPVSGATVEIIDTTGRVIRSTVTDGEGLFRFEDVPEGVYRLRIIRRGYRTETVTIEVLNGETTYVRIDVSPGDPCLLENQVASCEVENISFKEVGNPEDRESVRVSLPNGEEVELKKIAIAISLNMTLIIEGSNGVCVSEPVERIICHQVVMYAPPGTVISGSVTGSKCQVDLECRNGNLEAVILRLLLNQSLQTQVNATIQLNGSSSVMGVSEVEPQEAGPVCVNVTRVLDWVQSCIEKEIRIRSGEIAFNCSIS
ncbi:carboxypeptidase regulatory-like domain-containing protein [Halobacillus sp. GSS1]|uniref:carboxypeptidase regulatory-like domain-containing protein n=1 Tax=Halobacillus sp. GSS1 TaxID=2815919 RepID=UPI001A8CF07A|nr:carboxypeptidase regulatory-like domain-containing protein [Halobacillus sp. GSS1]MBN9654118.1 carboxypeptidase regulatory-like domain-containing protein [Halobacillus sp. GSS1]